LRELIRALIDARHTGEDIVPAAVVDRQQPLTDAERDILRQRVSAVLRRIEASTSGAEDGVHPSGSGAAGVMPLPSPRPEVPAPEPAAALPEPPAPPPPTTPAIPAAGSVLQALAIKCMEALGADLCQIFLSEEELLVLRAEAPVDPGTGASGPAGLSPRLGFTATVLATRLPLRLDLPPVIDGGAAKFGLHGTEAIWADRGMRHLAAVTVSPRAEGDAGILVVARGSADPFSDAELETLSALAAEVGLALASADLVLRAEELAVLKERMKLAREIHDGLASDLSAAVALFKYYEHRRLVDPEDAEALLLQMRGLIESSLKEARDIIATLRPRQQLTRRIADLIARHIEEFTRTYGITVNLKIDGPGDQLVNEERDAIYQILRESLTNVRRHAKAETVHVTIDLRQRPVTMRIEDDGLGIDAEAALEKAGSFGIIGMRERAELMGGSLTVEKMDRHGTRVTFRGPAIPLGAR